MRRPLPPLRPLHLFRLFASPSPNPRSSPFSTGFSASSLIMSFLRLLSSSTSIHRLLFVAHIFLCSIPGTLSSRLVTLSSIKIFTTHVWLPTKPIVYFQCQGENKTILPDVKEKDFLYIFHGEESWQPLTELAEKKCRRCGIYGYDNFKSDDVFDEWELCPGNFVEGKYVHFKENEFNATFICPQCNASYSVMAAGFLVLLKYWQKRKRERQQARFLKQFEEGDDIYDELGLDA
ncbi:hypothetical protein Cni_G25050 [Canna indica]|uniref:DUF7953 domain-containing protein n=1 Tax=Canna indica TaxID=4628 RepID=A0AAQ3KWF5_9LILI|nr:hypothetical protein Cni_G25050 [Canna indica]